MFESLSLISGPVPLAVLAASCLAVLGTVGWRRRIALKRQLLIGVPAAALATVALLMLFQRMGITNYGLPLTSALWGGFILLAIGLGAAGWTRLGWRQRAVAILALPLTLMSAGVLVNRQFQYLPTVGALTSYGSQHETTERALEKLRGTSKDASKLGYVVQIDIPGTKSHFNARPANVWLPPVWFADPTRKLPVIELLPGAPGSPSDWLVAGGAQQTAQAYATAHRGVAPIIVMPDPNGSETADTECVDSPLGNAETYLTEDVPDFVEKKFGAASATGSWAIAGLSAGGACSTMLALRHPDLYAAFADYSGLEGPTVGETMQPALTTQQLFGGSTAEYDAHQPAKLLATKRYPGMGGWFEVGSIDTGPLAAQQKLVPPARAAGITTCAAVIPNGNHDFETWTQTFRDSLPWLAARLRLTAAPASTAPATCS